MEMLTKAALPLGTSKKTWVWEKVCYPVGQLQGVQLDLPKTVPMEASRLWGHWLAAGAWVQVLPLLPWGLGRRGRTCYGLVFPEPSHRCCLAWGHLPEPGSMAEFSKDHPGIIQPKTKVTTLFAWGLL